jgi:hypothetical protein
MIDDIWGIEIVPMNVIVVKKGFTEKGAAKFTRVSYHASVKAAFINMHNMMIESSVSGQSIAEIKCLIEEMNRLNNLILEAIQKVDRRQI